MNGPPLRGPLLLLDTAKPKNYFAPYPAACMEFFDMSLVDEIPCMRSLKSSAFEALSSAVSYWINPAWNKSHKD